MKTVFGLVIGFAGAAALFFHVNEWACVVVIAIGFALVDLKDFLKVLTTVAPSLNKVPAIARLSGAVTPPAGTDPPPEP